MKNRKWIAICFAVSLAMGLSGCEWDDTAFTSLYEVESSGNSKEIYDGPTCSEHIVGITVSGVEIKTDKCKKNQYCADEDGVKPPIGSCLDAGEKCVGSEGLGNDNDFGYCLPGATCIEGKCESCAAGQILCDGECVDPKKDRFWCGAKDNCVGENSGKKCADGEVCSDGVCDTSCPGGQTICTTENGATCVDVQSDPNNCGDCGTKCPKGNACIDGACSASCLEGQELCGNACVVLASDPNNCGECGKKCPSGNACVEGECSASCLEGQELCGNACVILSSDPNNCGECGKKCPQGNACVEGECSASCLEGQELCDNACVILSSNPDNCGKCGNACPSGNACIKGECVVSCQDDLNECNGICVNLLTDVNNCGKCNQTCANKGEVCLAVANGNQTSATCSCPEGWTLCNKECVDLATTHRTNCNTCMQDWDNCNNDWSDGCETNLTTSNSKCGSCTKSCSGGQVCNNGKCDASCGGGLSICTVNSVDGCYNTKTDPLHCSKCNTACPTYSHATAACNKSACEYTCEIGYINCGTKVQPVCVDTSSDVSNCGVCSNKCGDNQSCNQGVCTCKSDVQLNCSGTCKYIKSDTQNCGACENKCSAMTPLNAAVDKCDNGVCIYKCSPNYTNCGSGYTVNTINCVDTRSDGKHCGQCNKACTNGTACSGSNCSTSCPTGQKVCDASCVTLSLVNLSGNCTTCATNYCDTDPSKVGCETQLGSNINYCTACTNGACASKANATARCDSKTCKYTCNAGFLNCGTDTNPNCVATANSPSHCGACNNSCTGLDHTNSSSCSSGICNMTCSTNFANCDSSTSNGCETAINTATNCGGCGINCNNFIPVNASFDKCESGVCKYNCQNGFENVGTGNTPTTIQCINTSITCDNSEVLCNNSCINPDDDSHYCGAQNPCNNAQVSGSEGVDCTAIPHKRMSVCTDGTCDIICESGYELYDNIACYKQYKLFNFTSATTDISDHGEGISSSIDNEQLKIVGMPKANSFAETKYVEFDIGTIAATTIAYVRFNAKAKNNNVKFKLGFYSGETEKGETDAVSVSTTPGLITPIEITNTAFSNLKIRMFVNKTNNGDNHLLIDDFEVYGY